MSDTQYGIPENGEGGVVLGTKEWSFGELFLDQGR